MNYQQLKDFCNSLTKEQLTQEVYLSQVDDGTIKVACAIITEEDEYFDHTDSFGTLEMVKKEYPKNWQEVISDATLLTKGTVMLCNE